MQADATMAPADRRNYKGIVDAVVRVAREEGVAGLWRGSSPTVARAMALNMAMLATADQAKEAFAPYLGGEKSTVNLVASSILSGVAASVASLPFDMVGFPFLPAFGAHHTVHGMCARRGTSHCARAIAWELHCMAALVKTLVEQLAHSFRCHAG